MARKIFIYNFEGKQLSNNTLQEKLDELSERGIEVSGYEINENELRITVDNVNEGSSMSASLTVASVTTITVAYVVIATMTMIGAYFVRLQFVKAVDKVDNTSEDTKKILFNITNIVKYGIIFYIGKVVYNEYKKL